MRPLIAALAVLLAFAAWGEAADPIVEARRLYNLGQYDAAERIARDALAAPGIGDAARVVLGRIRLERYRQTSEAKDLAAAREALRAIDPRALDSRERVELTVGQAEAMFLEDRFGAAAQLFEAALDSSAGLGAAAHERVLDWWATAVDRQAQTRPPEERPKVYARILDRMSLEITREPGSIPAAYWLAAAARGTGDLERAWSAAAAGWVRAPFARDRGAALRADIDRLVVQAIIPERAAKLSLRDNRQAQAGMLNEWETFKANWSR